MAKQLQHLNVEIEHFLNFQEFLPGMQKYCQATVKYLLADLGIIEVSTACEKAVADVGGHAHVSKPRGDLYRNGKYSDVKLSTARTYGYGKSYGAPITNIHNKTGSLRAQVYERKQKKFYYFVIPRRAYIGIPKTSNIEIPFELNGAPRRKPLRKTRVNWWRYEVPNFITMARK